MSNVCYENIPKKILHDAFTKNVLLKYMLIIALNMDTTTMQTIEIKKEVIEFDADIVKSEVEDSDVVVKCEPEEPGKSWDEMEYNPVETAFIEDSKTVEVKEIHFPNNFEKSMLDKGKSLCRKEAKKARNLGLPYITKNKKPIPERFMGPSCEKCKWKCRDNFPEKTRLEIFTKYWQLGSLEKQREFIAKSIKDLRPNYRCSVKEKPRNYNSSFYFNDVRVCKAFFINTLGVSERTVRTTRKKLKDGFLEGEMRGKHNNHPVLDEFRKQAARDFIKGIPRTECRAQTSREILDGSRSLSQVYRDYVKCEYEKGAKPVSESAFKRIFYTEFNVSFQSKKGCKIEPDFQNTLC